MAVSDKAKFIGAAAGGAMMLALGLWQVVEGTGPKSGDEFLSYQDIARVWTACYGHTGSDVVAGKRYTKKQCDELAESDLGKAFAAEDKYVVNVETMPIWTRAGVAVFIGNVGAEAFRTSTVRRELNAGHIEAACNAILLFNKSRVGGGPPVAVLGLINRREKERKLCLGLPW